MRVIAWLSVLLLIVAAGVVSAKAADTQIKIGIVDIVKVDAEAPRFKQYREQAGALSSSMRAKLEIRSQNLMLGDKEINELIDLSAKPNATAADKARIKALQDAERGLDTELKRLQEDKNLDDAKRARMKELNGSKQASMETVSKLRTDYEEQLASKEQEMLAQEEKDVRDACVAVAANKGYALILDKAAVWAGGTDVTADVIARLDRKM